VDALHIGPAAEPGDQVRIEAGRQAPGARGSGDEVQVVGPPAGRGQGPPGRRLGEGQRAAAEPVVQLVHALVGDEARGVDEEAAALDLAVLEEPPPLRITVPGQRQQLCLREPVLGHGRRDGGDPGERHPVLRARPYRVR